MAVVEGEGLVVLPLSLRYSSTSLPKRLFAIIGCTNSRTSYIKNIVDFNNRFFEWLRAFYQKENILLEGIYSDIAQQPRPKPGGFVTLRFIEETATIEEAAPMVFDQVKAIIDDCISRNYDYHDIAILVRENKNGQLVAEYLLQQGIPVVSPDSLILSRIMNQAQLIQKNGQYSLMLQVMLQHQQTLQA